MTQSERNRFTILVVILIVLVIVGVVVTRLRNQGKASADILGVIQNQAVATYQDGDGVGMQPSLSDISQLTVSGGVGNVTINYNLGHRDDQSDKLDLQFFRTTDDTPFDVINDKNGDQGTLVTQLKNIANGQYDISVKPLGFLSQTISNFNFQNGKQNLVTYKDPFLWGDIDVSHNGKGDNKINNADWAVFIKNWNTDDPTADFNGDGVVNNADATIILNNWNKQGTRFSVDDNSNNSTPVPQL